MEPCVQLAQRLAANEKKIRERALRKLRGYLSARSANPEGGFTLDEFCKIWKGLFYCMWMQDKPLMQEELAIAMSQLVHALQTRATQNLFIRSFWQTITREWEGIDRLRLDKFYTLIRLILHQSVELLKKGDWEESQMEEFLSILVDEVLKEAGPRGVQHHLMDIYLDEVAKVGASELPADVNLKLIEPFCKIAAKAKDNLFRESVMKGIFETILEQSPFAIEDLMKEIGYIEGRVGDILHGICFVIRSSVYYKLSSFSPPSVQFDYQALADRLFSLANRKNVPANNRNKLYWLVKRFKNLAAGIFPCEDFSRISRNNNDDDDHIPPSRLSDSRGAPTEPEKKGKRQHEAVTSDKPLKQPVVKKRKKNRPIIGEADHTKVNGVTEHPSTKEETEERIPQSPLKPEASKSIGLTTISRLKKRRHGCLLRLSLSTLPLRGALMMRRRRHIRERRKMISSKAAPITTSVVTSSPTTESSTTNQDFVTFQKSKVPKPLYVKGPKSRGRLISTLNCKSKKVTFSLNKNMTAEFKRTDRSLLVSPTGSSRVPFNPNQRPQHGVLKTPSPKHSAPRRPRAADFF
ncbi:ribosomal RNA processing [Pristimantis euphronides]